VEGLINKPSTYFICSNYERRFRAGPVKLTPAHVLIPKPRSAKNQKFLSAFWAYNFIPFLSHLFFINFQDIPTESAAIAKHVLSPVHVRNRNDCFFHQSLGGGAMAASNQPILCRKVKDLLPFLHLSDLLLLFSFQPTDTSGKIPAAQAAPKAKACLIITCRASCLIQYPHIFPP